MEKKLIAPAVIILLVLLAAVLEYGAVPIEVASPVSRFLFLVFLNLNVAALLVLVFYVGKSLKGLYSERKARVPGHKFKSKLVLLFVMLISIPTGLLFLTALGLGSNYIERLFTPQFRRPVENSIEIAKAVYELERKLALNAAKTARLGQGLRAPAGKEALPEEYRITRLASMPADASGAIRAAFEGESSAEVVSGKDTDIIRAAIPNKTPAGGPAPGIIVAERSMPHKLTASVKEIKEAYEDYVKLEAWLVPLKLNFLLILGFSTLMVVFLALWAALRIAGRITEPVKRLAEATESVARGDLSVTVDVKTGDEMGLLVESFNRMVREIRDSRESLQAAYAESDRRRLCMENIVENIQSGVFSLDPEGNVIMINSAALRLLDLGEKEVIGKNYSVILSNIESEELRRFIKEINLRTFQAVERQVPASLGGRKGLQAQSKTPSRATLRVSINSLRDGEGGYLGLLVVFDDLTNLIKAQRALAWQEVARRIAHEIKNPLTPIRLSTERMLKKFLSKDPDFGLVFERSTNTIIREVEGLRRLVDEFSRFGKMPEINRKPTNLKAVIDEVAGLYKQSYKDLNIEIIEGLISPGDGPIVDLDGEQFKRVLINLFDNAVEAMDGTGSISVRISPDTATGRVLIEVADTGPGIEEADKERLFQPYFSTKKHGTGLGLAIADRIIAEHGGYIKVRDNEPHGSIFAIELPIKEGG